MPTAAQVGADPAGTGASQAAVAVNARIPAGTVTGRYARWNNTAARWEEFDLLGAANTWTGANTFSSGVVFLANMGQGTNPAANNNMVFSANITGATTAHAVVAQGNVQSDVTAEANYFRTSAGTQAATFTLANMRHFVAAQGVIGAGSTVTTQIGFDATSSLIGATGLNVGFRGSIPSGTGRWNFFADGTAHNAFAGNVRIGSTAAPTVALDVTGNAAVSGNFGLGGASSFARINAGGSLSATATISYLAQSAAGSDMDGRTAEYYRTNATTAAASFTLSVMNHFAAAQNPYGAGSAVTTQNGFLATPTLIGATNNFGFRGSIPSGTGRWNLFMDGTANNAFAGNVRIGSTAAPTVALDVTGSATISGTLTIGTNATSAVQAGTVTGQLARWNNTTARYEPVTLNTLTDAADDAAAATAGVAVGGLYRTGSILKTRIA